MSLQVLQVSQSQTQDSSQELSQSKPKKSQPSQLLLLRARRQRTDYARMSRAGRRGGRRSPRRDTPPAVAIRAGNQPPSIVRAVHPARDCRLV